MNIQNYNKVLRQILAHPETRDPGWWDRICHETHHYFAGWAQILAGQHAYSGAALDNAVKWLELTADEAKYLFSFDRTVADFENFLDNYIARNASAPNINWHNANGYDRSGYNVISCNADGYDRSGYRKDERGT